MSAVPGKTGVMRKPSERFVRRPLKAKSRASQSERIRVSALASSLQQKTQTEALQNGETKFKDYRPGMDGSEGAG
jgi:hypothetical protein